MNMAKRLEALETAHAQQGGDSIRCYIRETDDETEAQARERLGLTDWPGLLLLLSESDARA
ncbi:MAG: hypothetical protein NTV11_05460 [Rhodocyclales bacterium]|nr:hypothetical protein [Rhodocyclales bacterium]